MQINMTSLQMCRLCGDNVPADAPSLWFNIAETRSLPFDLDEIVSHDVVFVVHCLTIFLFVSLRGVTLAGLSTFNL
jgi:hypothetical protein